jgi:hypothetical protein
MFGRVSPSVTIGSTMRSKWFRFAWPMPPAANLTGDRLAAGGTERGADRPGVRLVLDDVTAAFSGPAIRPADDVPARDAAADVHHAPVTTARDQHRRPRLRLRNDPVVPQHDLAAGIVAFDVLLPHRGLPSNLAVSLIGTAGLVASG